MHTIVRLQSKNPEKTNDDITSKFKSLAIEQSKNPYKENPIECQLQKYKAEVKKLREKDKKTQVEIDLLKERIKILKNKSLSSYTNFEASALKKNLVQQ